jgi:hypothetical protein
MTSYSDSQSVGTPPKKGVMLRLFAITILCLLDGLSLGPSSSFYLPSYHAQTMTHIR